MMNLLLTGQAIDVDLKMGEDQDTQGDVKEKARGRNVDEIEQEREKKLQSRLKVGRRVQKLVAC